MTINPLPSSDQVSSQETTIENSTSFCSLAVNKICSIWQSFVESTKNLFYYLFGCCFSPSQNITAIDKDRNDNRSDNEPTTIEQSPISTNLQEHQTKMNTSSTVEQVESSSPLKPQTNDNTQTEPNSENFIQTKDNDRREGSTKSPSNVQEEIQKRSTTTSSIQDTCPDDEQSDFAQVNKNGSKSSAPGSLRDLSFSQHHLSEQTDRENSNSNETKPPKITRSTSPDESEKKEIIEPPIQTKSDSAPPKKEKEKHISTLTIAELNGLTYDQVMKHLRFIWNRDQDEFFQGRQAQVLVVFPNEDFAITPFFRLHSEIQPKAPWKHLQEDYSLVSNHAIVITPIKPDNSTKDIFKEIGITPMTRNKYHLTTALEDNFDVSIGSEIKISKKKSSLASIQDWYLSVKKKDPWKKLSLDSIDKQEIIFSPEKDALYQFLQSDKTYPLTLIIEDQSYRVEEVIHRAESNSIFILKDPSTQKQVIMKLFFHSNESEKEIAKKLLQNPHDNIIPIRAVSTLGGMPCIVMDCIEQSKSLKNFEKLSYSLREELDSAKRHLQLLGINGKEDLTNILIEQTQEGEKIWLDIFSLPEKFS